MYFSMEDGNPRESLSKKDFHERFTSLCKSIKGMWHMKGSRGGWEAKCWSPNVAKTWVGEISMEVMEGARPSALLHKWKVDQFTICQNINLKYLTYLQNVLTHKWKVRYLHLQFTICQGFEDFCPSGHLFLIYVGPADSWGSLARNKVCR